MLHRGVKEVLDFPASGTGLLFDQSNELIPIPLNPREIVVGDFTPTLANLSLQLIPLSLDLCCRRHDVLLKSSEFVKSMLNDVERSAQLIQGNTGTSPPGNHKAHHRPREMTDCECRANIKKQR